MSSLPGDEKASKPDIEALRDVMTARFGGVDERFENVNQRFDGVSQRFDAVNERFDEVNRRLDAVDKSMERFEDKLDGFHHVLLTQSRTYLISMVGSIISTAGVVVAIIRFA